MSTRRDFAVRRASLLVALGLLATSCDAVGLLMVTVTGQGQLQVLGTGDNCNSTCGYTYGVPASYSITALPAPGWSFAAWGPDGDCASTGTTAIVFMTKAGATCHGTFVLNAPATLTVNTTGAGAGIVTGQGIACGNDCSETFTWGTAAYLTATPAAGSIFGGWTGCGGSGGPGACTVVMDTDKTVTARFDVPATLSVTRGGTGSGIVTAQGISCGTDCTETYAAGTAVALTATPDAGSTFAGWTNCGGGTGPGTCTVLMDADKTVNALFDAVTAAPVVLEVYTSAGGRVTSADSLVDCAGSGTGGCRVSYASGTSVTLTAVPDAGWHLDHWVNCPSQAGNACSVTMLPPGPVIVEAWFAVDLPTLLVVAKSGNGSGTVFGSQISCGTTCSQRFALSASVVLTAAPDVGSHFDRWLGDCRGISTWTSVVMNGDKTCTAQFKLGPGPQRPVIAAGNGHSCAIPSDGTVRCWGLGTWLGDGGAAGSLTPVIVSGILGHPGLSAVAIVAGGTHTCALLSDQTVACWGANGMGQLGNGTTTQALTPVLAAGIGSANSIGAGPQHTCAVLDDTTVRCWGYNKWGELGNGSTNVNGEPSPATVLVDATPRVLDLVVDVAASEYVTCALLLGGGAKCWGTDAWGELGTGQPELLQHPFADTDVVGLSGAVGIGSGGVVSGTSCALLSTGSAMCWGYGALGQLGNSASTSSRSPVPVGGLLGAIGGGVGREHVCANLASGGVLCWGAGTLGQLGNGIGLGSNTPVGVSGISTARAVGTGPAAQHSCAMLDDFSVWCWGRGHQGQLGDGAIGAGVFRTTPYRVSGF